ncbi:glycosyl hydrolase [Spirosoma soli]|uniref:Glycosyl hydrolase n=1 Tax=Spirosoma soli TaxID=1770529 RepID=A0ABW5M470_9BACT
MLTFLPNFYRLTTQRWLLAFLVSLCWFSAFAAPGDIKLEAESATLTGVNAVTTVPGYSGSGYVWDFDNAADNIAYTFPATAGEYELTIVYYSPYGEKHTTLNVNSVTSDQTFVGTNNSFGSLVVGKFLLKEGQNTVSLTNGWGYYGIDYIIFTPVSAKPPTVVPVVNGRIEAELGDLNGVNVATTPAGFSGSGYVTGFDSGTDKIVLSFSATAGLYDIGIGYTAPFGQKGFDIQVNEGRGTGMFMANPGFASVTGGKFLLRDGLNTITVNQGWGYFGIDYIQLTPATAPLPIKPPKTLVDAKATPSTRSLFSYIVDQYGSKVLSGQHDDLAYVLEQTGKEPAIASYDLIEYSPSRVQFGSNPTGQSERFINWAKKGDGRGIITLAWHWNAPTDLINQAPDRLWWSGFYTRATTFDLSAALADKSGERYNLLLRDIDVIATELKKFRDADIPVLWRPLHEAPGGWFWWGAKGPGPFKELWRIMYDRLTNYHNLHNLIWVYTGTDQPNMDWYPGDEYVDVLGLDIYADPAANLSGNWANTQSALNGKKLATLSETGNLPKPENIRGFATWWSWFAVWTGNDYIRKQPLDLLKAVYNDKDVITRDELPDWRAYGQLQVQAPTYDCTTGAITFKSTGGDGTPVEYKAIGVKDWSTDPNGFVDEAVRKDPKLIQLLARQSGQVASYTFDLPAACPTTPPTGGALTVLAPTYDCQTGAITFKSAGGDGTPIEYMAIGIKTWSTDPNGVVEAGLRGDPKPIELLARQNGVVASFTFDLQLMCPTKPVQPAPTNDALVMLAPTYNCATGAIKFNTQGGTGNPIEYMAIGVMVWSTNPYGTVEPGLRGDPKVIELMAKQGGVVVTYSFDLPNACPSGARRPALTDSPLNVNVLGNPARDNLKFEVTGATGQSLRLILTDIHGREIHVRQIEQAGATESISVPLDRQSSGMLLLRASTPTQLKTVKIVKE